MHAMATSKTRSVSARVPNYVAEALRADAADFHQTPGEFLRALLEKRYAFARVAEKSTIEMRKSDFIRLEG